jgi:hypothetical protein
MRFAEIVNKLNKEVNAAVDDPKMKARLADLGGTDELAAAISGWQPMRSSEFDNLLALFEQRGRVSTTHDIHAALYDRRERRFDSAQNSDIEECGFHAKRPSRHLQLIERNSLRRNSIVAEKGDALHLRFEFMQNLHCFGYRFGADESHPGYVAAWPCEACD